MSRHLCLVVALLALVASAAAFDCTFASTYPRHYVVAELDAHEETPLLRALDGRLDDAAWLDARAPFTPPFVDISTDAQPPLRTQVKMRWSAASGTLYIGAELEEPAACGNITATCHCIDPLHDQVIFHDNDFEVFVDADASTHNYKEFEINAYNATWILLLDRPYDDGGSENSTRVLGKHGFDMQPPARSGVYVDGGRLSDPRYGPTRRWTLEVALPLERLASRTRAAGRPVQAGDVWRINFSRVRWNNVVSPDGAAYWRQPSCTTCPVPGAPAEDNWVWSAQRAIAMHLPERWGVLQFAGVDGAPPAQYAQWPVRSVLAAVYYAQHAYAAAHGGAYTLRVADLLPYVQDAAIIDGTCAHAIVLSPRASVAGFEAHVTSADGAWHGTIRDDRYTTVEAI